MMNDNQFETADPAADIGVIGLAVMGQNLVLNMADHGFRIAVFNRSSEVTRAFLDGPARDYAIREVTGLGDLVAELERPRRVMLMVRAGSAVDAVIDDLIGLLEPGDIVIDGGNSAWQDTERRLAPPRRCRHPVRRDRRIRGRRRRPARTVDHAGWVTRGVGARGPDPPGDRRPD